MATSSSSIYFCFLGEGEEVCDDDDECVSEGEWRGESQLELDDESHDDDEPTNPPPNCWRADVMTSTRGASRLPLLWFGAHSILFVFVRFFRVEF